MGPIIGKTLDTNSLPRLKYAEYNIYSVQISLIFRQTIIRQITTDHCSQPWLSLAGKGQLRL